GEADQDDARGGPPAEPRPAAACGDPAIAGDEAAVGERERHRAEGAPARVGSLERAPEHPEVGGVPDQRDGQGREGEGEERRAGGSAPAREDHVTRSLIAPVAVPAGGDPFLLAHRAPEGSSAVRTKPPARWHAPASQRRSAAAARTSTSAALAPRIARVTTPEGDSASGSPGPGRQRPSGATAWPPRVAPPVAARPGPRSRSTRARPPA